MKRNYLLLVCLTFFLTASSQDFTGQWKGEFIDKSTSFSGFGGDQCEYIIELDCKGNNVSGSSYTYFTDGGKRYYTICKLEGFIDRKQQYIEVKEVERTKTNVPVNIRNCFQVHKLTYFKHADTATLEGKWVPAPNQQGDCGYGTTLLVRRELKQAFPGFNSMASKSAPPKKQASSKIAAAPVNKARSPIAVSTPPPAKKIPSPNNTIKAPPPRLKTPTNNTAILSPVKKNSVLKRDSTPASIDTTGLIVKKAPDAIIAGPSKFEKRNNTILKTFEVENKTVKVDLYDNGEVDGDSISLFYNGKLLMSSQRLSEKPITLTINIEDDTVNELVMYAENLGTIPPNTALMVVTDGVKRYEVRITSDLQKSGVIHFIHKPNLSGK